MGDPSAAVLDASESPAEHLSVKKLVIGSWSLTSKYDEHVLLSFYWPERKVVWEVLHLGVVRKMEADFEDLNECVFTTGIDLDDKLTLDLQRPPRFFKESVPAGSGNTAAEVNYVYTTDFTNGQASAENCHTIFFEPGVIGREILKRLSQHSIRVAVEGDRGVRSTGDRWVEGVVGSQLASVRGQIRRPPTTSPRLDAIVLKDQLNREMRERQAKYTGICPVRQTIYARIFDQLIASVARDEPKRGMLLRRVQAESSLTMDAYRTVFESSIEFGSRQLSQGVDTKGDLEHRIAELDLVISELRKSVLHLRNLCESLEHREAQKAKAYETKDKEEVDLANEKQQLEELLAVLRLSKADKK